jgi:hypothetical protein
MRVWDTVTGGAFSPALEVAEIVKSNLSPGPVNVNALWTFHQGKHVVLWDLGQRRPVAVVDHGEEVHTSLLIERGQSLMTVGGKTVRLWQTTTRQPFASRWFSCQPLSPPLRHDEEVRQALVLGSVVYAAGGSEVRAWAAPNWTPLPALAAGGPVLFVGGVTNGLLVLTRSAVQLWAPHQASPGQAGQKLAEAALPRPPKSWRWARNGLLVLTDEGGEVHRVVVNSGWGVQASVRLAPLAPDYYVSDAGFSADGARVLTRGTDGAVQLWDTVAGKPLEAMLQHDTPVTDARFTPDGRHLVTRSLREVRLWESAGGRLVWKSELPVPAWSRRQIIALPSPAFSPDGRFCYFAGEKDKLVSGQESLRVEIEGGAVKMLVPEPPRETEGATGVLEVAAGAARFLFTRSTSSLQQSKTELLVWDLATARPAGPALTFPEHVLARLSPDGALLAVAVTGQQLKERGQYFEVRVWEVARGRPLTPSLAVTDLQAMEFTPDGTCLLTRTKSEARLWEARTGDPISPPLPVRGALAGHRFGAGGRLLMLQTDREAAVFDVSPETTTEELVRAARLRAGRMIDDSGGLTLLPGEELAAMSRAPRAGPGLAAHWRDVYDRDRQQAADGKWKAEGKELVQETLDEEALLLFGDAQWTDYDLELEATPTRGAGEVSAVVRAAGRTDFTVVLLGGWNNTRHGVLPLAGGQFLPTVATPGKTVLNQWYRLKVEVRGRTCRLFLDGKLLATHKEVPSPGGQVGMRTVKTAARFRNIKVTDPAGKVLFEGLPPLSAARDK